MAVLQEMERENQDVDRRESENKLLCRPAENELGKTL